MIDEPRPPLQRSGPADKDPRALRPRYGLAPQDAVLARLLGRQIAREEFQRRSAAARGHALRSKSDRG